MKHCFRQARMNAKMTRKFTSIVAESNCAFILVTHLSTMIGTMSRDPMIISGGYAIAYAASITLDLRKKSILDTDPINREDGIKIGVTVKKNHCVPERNPYVKTEYYAIFGEGIEQHLSTLENAIKQGVLTQAGAWIKDFDDNGEIRQWDDIPLNFQGKEKYRNFVIEHPGYLANLKSRIRGDVIQMTLDEVAAAKAEEEEIAKKAETKEPEVPVKKKAAKKAS